MSENPHEQDHPETESAEILDIFLNGILPASGVSSPRQAFAAFMARTAGQPDEGLAGRAAASMQGTDDTVELEASRVDSGQVGSVFEDELARAAEGPESTGGQDDQELFRRIQNLNG